MLHDVVRAPFRALLSGLMLTACGGIPETEPAPSEESLGTRQAALCSGLSVTTLTIHGISSYQGEAAGSGDWAVSTFANGVRMEYYVDNALRNVTEYPGTSGTWYFSSAGMGCGGHTFEVRAYPMVIASDGSRTACFETPRSELANFDQYCAPTASMSCQRLSTTLRCNGSASGGSSSYTPYWQSSTLNPDVSDEPYLSGWSAGTWSKDYYCPPISSLRDTYYSLQVQFKVLDTTGTWSNVSSSASFKCKT